ncbi:MAG: tetratricopeptide repeat protein [Acidobacteriota bacterium]|nr:tetratricopeptide repeat protein [Acidobacteriota bacterium]
MQRSSKIHHNRFLAILCLVFITLVAAKSASGEKQGVVTPVRVADVQCAECHRSIYESYLATPMANASGLAANHLKTATFLHQNSGETYSISDNHGKPTLSYSGPDGVGSVDLKYSLGSGHLGITYLYQIDHYLFESPIAWYAPTDRYDMKPGLAPMRQMPPPLPMESDCMRCHMSGAQHSKNNSVNDFSNLPFLHAGITCEECHGDASQHVLTGGKAAVVNPARLSADRRDSICISCHLEGDVKVEKAGKSPVDFRPGDAISDFLTYYVRAGENMTVRGVSEVEQLSESTCKRMSGDKMSCTSCHDPHYTPDAAHRVEFYRGKCLACHSGANFEKIHFPQERDCTICHMPRTKARNILHVAWTDHRILRVPEEKASEQSTDSAQKLVPIFSPTANARDLAMAYYKALLSGYSQFEPIAWKMLNQQKAAFAHDKDALDALGNMSAKRGDATEAEHAYRQVLALDPNDTTALTNLAVLLAKQGDLKASIQMLQTAFSHNQDLPGLAMNLARVQCIAGKTAEAQSTLKTALIYTNNYQPLEILRKQLTHCSEQAGSGGMN